jgi:hypothetical protein
MPALVGSCHGRAPSTLPAILWSAAGGVSWYERWEQPVSPGLSAERAASNATAANELAN